MITASSDASMPGYLIVLVTIDDCELGLAIARSLVQERLAACVQMGGPIDSVYVWQRAVETAAEWTLSIKTRGALYPRLERRLLELHSYAQPQILALPVVAGSAGYLEWLDASTHVAVETGATL